MAHINPASKSCISPVRKSGNTGKGTAKGDSPTGSKMMKANLQRTKTPTNWNVYKHGFGDHNSESQSRVNHIGNTNINSNTNGNAIVSGRSSKINRNHRSKYGLNHESDKNRTSPLTENGSNDLEATYANAAAKTSTESQQRTQLTSLETQFRNNNLLPPNNNVFKHPKRCVAIDCEMVGINDGRDNMLARVSLVDETGSVIYDSFVQPQQKVIDYRTHVSGVRPADMLNGCAFKKVQKDVYSLLKGKLLVGHAVRNDMNVLALSHPKKSIRDTSKFRKFREEVSGRTPSLRFLASHFLGVDIQDGEHSSVEDARATMLLYLKFGRLWEGELRPRYFYRH